MEVFPRVLRTLLTRSIRLSEGAAVRGERKCLPTLKTRSRLIGVFYRIRNPVRWWQLPALTVLRNGRASVRRCGGGVARSCRWRTVVEGERKDLTCTRAGGPEGSREGGRSSTRGWWATGARARELVCRRT